MSNEIPLIIIMVSTMATLIAFALDLKLSKNKVEK